MYVFRVCSIVWAFLNEWMSSWIVLRACGSFIRLLSFIMLLSYSASMNSSM